MLCVMVLALWGETLGIYNPDWEIKEIIQSKMPLQQKLEALKKVLKDAISPKSASELLKFLDKEAPKKKEEFQKLIKIRSQALA